MSISKERKKQLRKFQKKYSLRFKDLELLNQAFVHTSYTNENALDEKLSYEKLEFYGDAVLKLSISDFLYNHFVDYSEGELTKLRAELVSDKNIFEYAKILGFEELILLGRNEKKQGGAKKESILACAFEALLGAIFINYGNKGYKKVKAFLEQNFMDDILSIDKKIKFLNPKAILQEYTQGINHKLPEYVLVDEVGKAHNKEFFVEVKFNDEVIGKGCAKSIKKAQSEAAFDALKNLNLIEE
ncbi:MAG: ribonuclease III [Candidatus Gastranaerophilales bacterium]|nr:ribonuclease III [Candidatus Gastranaerophilales bacterium]